MNERRLERCPCLMGWPVDPERDYYCGHCGRRLRTLEAAPLENAEHPWIRGSETLRVDVRTKNTGIVPAAVQGLEWVSPSPSGECTAAHLDPPAELQPGEEKILSFAIRIPEKARKTPLIALRLQSLSPSGESGGFKCESFEMALKPPPRLKIPGLNEAKILTAEKLEEGAWLSIAAADHDILLAEGAPIVLKAVDGGEPVPFDRQAISIRILRANQPARLKVSQLEALFPGETKERDVYVEIQAQGIAVPIRTPYFTLKLQTPVDFDLQFDAASRASSRVLKGSQRSFGIALVNRSKRIFAIERIAAALPESLQAAGLRAHLSLDRPPPFFVDNKSKTEQSSPLGKLIVNAEQWTGDGIKSEARLDAILDTGAVKSFVFPIEITASSIEHESPLGIDFGNTNSSAAVLNDLLMPEMVPLPPLMKRLRPNPHVIPTIVRYAPAGEYRSEWEAKAVKVEDAGGPAHDRFEQDPSLGGRTVHFFKPRLGMGKTHAFPYMPEVKNKSLDSVAADYLRRLLQAIEEETGRRHRQIVLSHPVRFWTRQREALRSALLEAVLERGQDPQARTIHFIDEATAALLYDTMARRQENAANGTAHEVALVFDFGGGTIDMTLCEIVHDLEKNQWTIRHLDFDGTSDFGGEQITEMIAEMLYASAREAANGRMTANAAASIESSKNRQEKNGLTTNRVETRWLPSLDGAEASAANPEKPNISSKPDASKDEIIVPFARWDAYYSQWGALTRTAMGNYQRLYYDAEDLKISLSENAPFQERQSTVMTVPAGDPGAEPAPIYFNVIHSKEELECAIHRCLDGPMKMAQEMIKRLHERAQREGDPYLSLTRVVMTGQSSRIKLIQDRLRDAVNEANRGRPVEVKPLEMIKEAVAMGAAVYGALRELTDVEINRASRVFLFLQSSSLGIGASAFVPIVKRLDPLPAEMLCSRHRESGIYFPLRLGQRFKVIESFVDLSNPKEVDRAEKDKDYRILAEVEVTPPDWSEEQVKNAILRFTFSEDEQLNVEIIQEDETNGEEAYILWPKRIEPCVDAIM
ncbi:MAG: Hsp70 family protein [Candidatus Omnitrophota bacterium]